MDIVDDTRLLELAQEPVREIFPTARQGISLKPIVVLLAFLPGLLLFRQQPVDESTAKAGLCALQVSAAETPLDWLRLAGRVTETHDSTPEPLLHLVTALGLKVELLAPVNRLRLVAYGSFVLFLLSLFGFASQLGNSRVAAAVVLLTCCHRELWTLSHELPPIALTLAFSLLSFRAFLAHQAKEEAALSWPLLGAGSALAACWLAGGFTVWASWAVIGIASCAPVRDERSRASLPHKWRRRIQRVLMRGVSFGILSSVTLLFVALWRVFALQIQPTTTEAFGIFDLFAHVPVAIRSFSWDLKFGLVAQSLISLCGALLGLFVLGAVYLTRSVSKSARSPLGVNERFVVIWFVVALLAWLAFWNSHQGEFSHGREWPSFLMIPLMLLAAYGMEGILCREFSLRSIVSVMLATSFVTVAPYLPNPLKELWTWEIVGLCVIALLAAAVVAVAAVFWLSTTERRQRGAMISCLVIVVASDMTLSVCSLEALSGDERELIAFRQQLSSEPTPNECWLISDGVLPSDAPPARLRFFLQCEWPDSSLRLAPNWETMFVEANADATDVAQRKGKGPRRMVVIWGDQKLPAADVKQRGQTLTQVTSPHYFQRRTLKAYSWSVADEIRKSQVVRIR